jgi:hypothetical protein
LNFPGGSQFIRGIQFSAANSSDIVEKQEGKDGETIEKSKHLNFLNLEKKGVHATLKLEEADHAVNVNF